MRRPSFAVHVVLLVITVLLSTTLIQAQYRASIQGVVTDQQGAVVPGATVTLTNKETNRAVTATSDGAGIYNIGALPPSTYSLTVEKAGFKKKSIDNFTVLSEQANALNIELVVGQSSETVNVAADQLPAIDTESATISGTVTSKQIQTLPSFGRDVFQLAQLAPGAFGDGAQDSGGGSFALPGNAGPGGVGNETGVFATENGPQISAGGGRRELNNYQIDGVGMTSVSWAGTAVITPNEDSVKEVKVVTNGYDAEDGRYPGAQVKVISQNGTNQYHGSAFIKTDQPNLNAYQRFGANGNAPQRDNAKFQDFGGSVGGPILHNKLFAFFSYEAIRTHSISNSQGWFWTPAYLALAQSGSAFAAFANYGGSSKQASPFGTVLEDPNATTVHDCAFVGMIPGTNCLFIPNQGLNVGRPLDPAKFPLGTADPAWQSSLSPGLGGDGTGSSSNLDPTTADLQFVNATSPSNTIEAQYNGRIDFNVTSKDLLAFSLYRVPTSNDSYNGAFVPMNLFHHTVINEAETLLWDHTFSPTIVNELRINAAGWRWKDLQNNPNGPWGLPNLFFQDVFAPNNNDNVAEGYGTANIKNLGIGAPGTFDQWTYAAKDVLTKVYRSHTIKVGGEVTKLLFVDNSPWNARPQYYFDNLWDAQNDAPQQETATFNPLTGVPTDFRKDTRSTLLGFFAQDDYKVRSNLTINLGLRWEYNGPVSEKNGHLATPVLGSGANALTGIRVKVGGNLYKVSKNDFGPQIGFAWNPDKYNRKIVFRGGFGIGFTGQEEATSLNGRNNPPLLSPTGNLLACADPPKCTANQVVYGLNTFPSNVHSFYGYASNPNTIFQFDPTTNLPIPTSNFSSVQLTGYPASWPDTRTYRYSFEAQGDLGHEWVATLGYQGTASRNLTRQYSLNMFLWGTQHLAFNPLVPNIAWFDDGGRANFNALLANVRHRFSRSFQVETQYRWSKSMDTGSNNYAGGNYQYTLSHEYGPSDYDATHAFKVFGIWSPTIFHGSQGYLEKVFGNWNLSGILNAHSGFPWSPVFNSILTGFDDKGNPITLNPCDAVFQGSCNNGGSGNLYPEAYLGGAGTSTSTDVFKQRNGNFSKVNGAQFGGQVYFSQPSLTKGPTFSDIIAGNATPGPLPGAPGVGRNSFRGPRYFDVDMTLSKAFGLPKMRVLGEGAKFELRANFFNIFNKLNLANIDNNVNSSTFGTATKTLGSRTVELQARFSF
jgi:Carboxypeptidase regulatory-like domain